MLELLVGKRQVPALVRHDWLQVVRLDWSTGDCQDVDQAGTLKGLLDKYSQLFIPIMKP